MVTTTRTTSRKQHQRAAADSGREQVQENGISYVSRNQGTAILDRQARKYLGMSGDEFVRKYQAGEIDDPDRSDVVAVAMLIPLTER